MKILPLGNMQECIESAFRDASVMRRISAEDDGYLQAMKCFFENAAINRPRQLINMDLESLDIFLKAIQSKSSAHNVFNELLRLTLHNVEHKGDEDFFPVIDALTHYCDTQFFLPNTEDYQSTSQYLQYLILFPNSLYLALQQNLSILEMQDEDGNTLLHHFLFMVSGPHQNSNKMELVQIILSPHCDIHHLLKSNINNETPIELTARFCGNHLIAQKIYMPVIDIAVAAEYDFNVCNSKGYNMLHYTAMGSNFIKTEVNCVKLLLETADNILVDTPANRQGGYSAAMYCSARTNQAEFGTLISHGADLFYNKEAAEDMINILLARKQGYEEMVIGTRSPDLEFNAKQKIRAIYFVLNQFYSQLVEKQRNRTLLHEYEAETGQHEKVFELLDGTIRPSFQRARLSESECSVISTKDQEIMEEIDRYQLQSNEDSLFKRISSQVLSIFSRRGAPIAPVTMPPPIEITTKTG
jgi:ankyrin repeat protein